MSNQLIQQASAKSGSVLPVAVKLQSRSMTVALHSANHATTLNSQFAWR